MLFAEWYITDSVIRSWNVAYLQWGQIKKIGWESEPSRENLYILQKLEFHWYDSFAIFKSLTK